ncbi:MAG: hypothetical protein AAF799_17495 [Myxococcota bacterium]
MTTLHKTFGVLTCALFLGACGPSSTDICDKMIELAKKEGSDAMVKKLEEDRGECIAAMDSAKEMQGAMKFKESGNCIMDAATFKDAIQCRE